VSHKEQEIFPVVSRHLHGGTVDRSTSPPLTWIKRRRTSVTSPGSHRLKSAMPVLIRRRDLDRADCWLIHYGDVRVRRQHRKARKAILGQFDCDRRPGWKRASVERIFWRWKPLSKSRYWPPW